MDATIRNPTFAEMIDSVAKRPRAEFRLSKLGHQEAFDELWDVWQECNVSGWDGYNAMAVERDTLTSTYRLIESLPLNFPRPSLGAEPDGHVTLEWHKSPSRTLSVSVDPDGYLHYAGLFGGNKRYGTLEFFGVAPEELIRLVREL
jgi:hypothetical protein